MNTSLILKLIFFYLNSVIRKSPAKQLSPMNKSDSNTSSDSLKGTSSRDDVTASDLETSSPKNLVKNKIQACTSTPVRSNANKENAVKATDSNKKKSGLTGQIGALRINSSKTPPKKDEWLSKSTIKGNALVETKFKTPNTKKPVDKKVESQDLFNDESNTIPPSIETKTATKHSRLRLKQTKLAFNNAPTDEKHTKKMRLDTPSDEKKGDKSIFDDGTDDISMEDCKEIKGAGNLGPMNDDTYVEGLTLPSQRALMEKKAPVKQEKIPDCIDDEETHCEELSLINRQRIVRASSVVSVHSANCDDEVIIIPDSLSTQDMFDMFNESPMAKSTQKPITVKQLSPKPQQKSPPKQSTSKPSPPKRAHEWPEELANWGCDECAEVR